MNLAAIVSGIVSAVNPRERFILQRSSKYTTAASGARTPVYQPPLGGWGQMQSMSSGDLRQVEGLNQNGTHRSIYLSGDWDATVRSEIRGGDLIMRPKDNSTWLVTQVLEHWSSNGGWTKVAVTLQNGG